MVSPVIFESIVVDGFHQGHSAVALSAFCSPVSRRSIAHEESPNIEPVSLLPSASYDASYFVSDARRCNWSEKSLTIGIPSVPEAIHEGSEDTSRLFLSEASESVVLTATARLESWLKICESRRRNLRCGERGRRSSSPKGS